MAEKRRLPPRERRESAAKKRISEVSTPVPQTHKKKTIPKAAPPPLPELDKPLPTKIKDGEGLPIVRALQPTSLSDKEYQSIADRCALRLIVNSYEIQSLTCFPTQWSPPCLPGTVQEEMAERWHSGAILHEAEEDEA